jgi:hypothetical protein
MKGYSDIMLCPLMVKWKQTKGVSLYSGEQREVTMNITGTEQ